MASTSTSAPLELVQFTATGLSGVALPWRNYRGVTVGEAAFKPQLRFMLLMQRHSQGLLLDQLILPLPTLSHPPKVDLPVVSLALLLGTHTPHLVPHPILSYPCYYRCCNKPLSSCCSLILIPPSSSHPPTTTPPRMTYLLPSHTTNAIIIINVLATIVNGCFNAPTPLHICRTYTARSGLGGWIPDTLAMWDGKACNYALP